MAFGKDKHVLEERVQSVESKIELAILSMEKAIDRMEQRDSEYRNEMRQELQEYRSQTNHNISMMRWALGLGLSALLAFTLYQNSTKPQQPQMIVVHPRTPNYIEEIRPPRVPNTTDKTTYQP